MDIYISIKKKKKKSSIGKGRVSLIKYSLPTTNGHESFVLSLYLVISSNFIDAIDIPPKTIKHFMANDFVTYHKN